MLLFRYGYVKFRGGKRHIKQKGDSMKKSLEALSRECHQRMDGRTLHLSNRFERYEQLEEALSEHEILMLQDQFLTNGFHYITVPDVKTGRELLYIFLNSLDCYHHVACLTVEQEPLNSGISDLYQELCSFTNVEEFLVDQFYYDFIWIELSARLCKHGWLDHFKQSILQMELDAKLPLVIIRYDGDVVSSAYTKN